MAKFADRAGVDGDKFGPAVFAAVQIKLNTEYDRKALIPEVTRQVNATFVSIAQDLMADKKKTCKKWSDTLVKLDLMKRVQ
jgi:hypothetical protein